jgi:hypothetical protein
MLINYFQTKTKHNNKELTNFNSFHYKKINIFWKL